jgi:dTDP-4-dehydrorhamnose 3,5-epimerase
VRVTAGKAFLAMIDIRKNSPTLGKWFGLETSPLTKKMVYVPPGFANGFCALEEGTEIQYKCTGVYNSKAEGGILWNDPEVGVRWPVRDPKLSEKDRSAPTLKQWLARPDADRFAMKV